MFRVIIPNFNVGRSLPWSLEHAEGYALKVSGKSEKMFLFFI
jgi:hypothetical protein